MKWMLFVLLLLIVIERVEPSPTQIIRKDYRAHFSLIFGECLVPFAEQLLDLSGFESVRRSFNTDSFWKQQDIAIPKFEILDIFLHDHQINVDFLVDNKSISINLPFGFSYNADLAWVFNQVILSVSGSATVEGETQNMGVEVHFDIQEGSTTPYITPHFYVDFIQPTLRTRGILKNYVPIDNLLSQTFPYFYTSLRLRIGELFNQLFNENFVLNYEGLGAVDIYFPHLLTKYSYLFQIEDMYVEDDSFTIVYGDESHGDESHGDEFHGNESHGDKDGDKEYKGLESTRVSYSSNDPFSPLLLRSYAFPSGFILPILSDSFMRYKWMLTSLDERIYMKYPFSTTFLARIIPDVLLKYGESEFNVTITPSMANLQLGRINDTHGYVGKYAVDMQLSLNSHSLISFNYIFNITYQLAFRRDPEGCYLGMIPLFVNIIHYSYITDFQLVIANNIPNMLDEYLSLVIPRLGGNLLGGGIKFYDNLMEIAIPAPKVLDDALSVELLSYHI